MNEVEENSINIRELFGLLRKRIKLIAVITVLATVIGGVYVFIIAKPVYGATTQLIFKLPNSGTNTINTTDVQGNIQLVNTINQVVVSPAILDDVKKNLNLTETVSEIQKEITTSSATNSFVINISVMNSSPTMARDIANETAKVFKSQAKGILPVDNMAILSNAVSNSTPVGPNKKLYIGISVILGLLIGSGLALLLEFMDNTIDSEEDIEQILGRPLLGVVPLIEGETNLVHPSSASNRTGKNSKRGK